MKFLEASAEWETTRKDHSESKGFIFRRRKLLMASHNIPFVLLIEKEFESFNLTMRLKQAVELLHALVLTINKVPCRQDKTISQIKD